MIREGDVYTCNFNQGQEKRIRACYRPFIIVGIENEFVTGVPLTTRVSDFVDPKCVYTTMTVNKITKNVCVLAYMPVRIPKKNLIKKIAYVDKMILTEIKNILKNSVSGYQSSIGEEDSVSINLNDPSVNKSNINTGIIPVDGQDIKEVLRILEGMNSKKCIWKERIISFILGVLASILASIILMA